MTEEEAATFAANSIVVGRTVIMPACPPRLGRQLESWDLDVVVVDVGEFIKAGGAVRCMTLPLDTRMTRSDRTDRHTGTDGGCVMASTALALEKRYGANNYHPLPVVISHASGAYVTDEDGRRYLDALAAYSAVNFGHGNPRLVAAAKEQLDRVTLTSRAFHNDQLGHFCAELAALCGMDRMLPMNTGAEAVETGIKTARKWGYEVKGVPDGKAEIIVADGNFHGRTTTIVSFSDDPAAHDHFGPYTPGFIRVPYGSVDAIRAAITDNTVAVLIEPIQGEAGVVIPPEGYLRGLREVCDETNVLFIADEIQAGLGRTGRTFACEHEGVQPDLYLLGKALGGGIVPVSAVVGNDEVIGVFGPGQHGSTFGGNPLACAVGREVVAMLDEGEYQENAAVLGRPDEAAPGRGGATGCEGGPCQGAVAGHRAHRRGPPGTALLRGAVDHAGRWPDGTGGSAGKGHPGDHDQTRPAPGHHRRGGGLDRRSVGSCPLGGGLRRGASCPSRLQHNWRRFPGRE